MSSITWHQWHHTASRSSRTNLCCCLACAKAASDHGCQCNMAGCCCCAAQQVAIARRIATLRNFIGVHHSTERAEGRDGFAQILAPHPMDDETVHRMGHPNL